MKGRAKTRELKALSDLETKALALWSEEMILPYQYQATFTD